MKIKTKDLLDVVDHFKFIFNNNNYIEAANYIIFNTLKNTISCFSDQLIYIYNFKGCLKDSYGLESAVIVVSAKELFTLLRKLNKEEIDVRQKGDAFIVKSGRSVSKFLIHEEISDKQETPSTPLNWLRVPTKLKYYLKTFTTYDKNIQKCDVLVLEDGCLVSSDGYTITKADLNDHKIKDSLGIRWDVLKHISSKDFSQLGCNDSTIIFGKENYTLICQNRIEEAFTYKDLFEEAMEELDFSNSIYMDKEESIDFIEAFLIDYKKLDKKIDVSILNSRRLTLFAGEDGGSSESKTAIDLTKYTAGHKDSFSIAIDYFKAVYSDYDYFNILDNMLYAYNVEHSVERLIKIDND